MITLQRKVKGFTLLEILLVLAIASSLVVLMLNYTTQKSDELRRDKTVLQMQQILNAGLSFYLANAYWPLAGASINSQLCNTAWTATTALKPNYIPTTLVNNPYANPYFLNCASGAQGGGFYAYTTANNPTNAAIIAGRLPLAFITTPASVTSGTLPITQPAACTTAPYTGCTVVVASVSVPGQNLNNARSINFAGVYNNGACVPAPNCPPNMSPAIFVTPVSIAGITNTPTCTNTNDPSTCTNIQTYPLTSFVAFARGSDLTTGAPAVSTGSGATINASPLDCTTSVLSGTLGPQPTACNSSPDSSLPATEPAGTKYWRVCLVVFTQNGQAYPPTSAGSNKYNMGKLIGSIMAVTRCVPNNGTETPQGSPITVWTPNTGNHT